MLVGPSDSSLKPNAHFECWSLILLFLFFLLGIRDTCGNGLLCTVAGVENHAYTDRLEELDKLKWVDQVNLGKMIFSLSSHLLLSIKFLTLSIDMAT